jgi:hypothetical protein
MWPRLTLLVGATCYTLVLSEQFCTDSHAVCAIWRQVLPAMDKPKGPYVALAHDYLAFICTGPDDFARGQLVEEEITLTSNLDQARARAEKSFKQEERAKEGARAMMEYQANSELMREKTERLRALRLAKEAAVRTQASS